jgi:hypothetical protein
MTFLKLHSRRFELTFFFDFINWKNLIHGCFITWGFGAVILLGKFSKFWYEEGNG